jgi:hypothetical protein
MPARSLPGLADVFTGTVPASLSLLQHLEIINLAGSNLAGGVPEGYGRLSKLRLL